MNLKNAWFSSQNIVQEIPFKKYLIQSKLRIPYSFESSPNFKKKDVAIFTWINVSVSSRRSVFIVLYVGRSVSLSVCYRLVFSSFLA